VLTRFDAEQPEGALVIGDVIKRRLKQLEQIAQERATGARVLSGYPTGVERLDEKTGGWQAGIVSIVAARPAMGKSSLGLATANASSEAGFGVHLFSLEDTEQAYADRALSRASGVSAENLRNSELSAVSMEQVRVANRKLQQRKGWLFDGRSGITADEIVRSVRRRRRDNGTKVVIVDYVQLVKRPARMSGHEALSEIVTTFADAAKQDSMAYVVMSQLNRELEKREDKRPQLSDLRESGSLEERAKCVVGVYRGSVYGGPRKGVDYAEDQRQPSQDEHAGTVQLLVLKNSNGRTGLVKASWFGPTTRIE
jgi:replicative DNA helicase